MNGRNVRETWRRAPLRRVNRANPCPICGGDSWCGYTEDGLVLCARNLGDTVPFTPARFRGISRNQAGIWLLEGLGPTPPRRVSGPKPKPKKEEKPLPPPEEVDAELARVLDRLDLSPEEEAALSRRGFPPPIARELGYRSYEEDRWPKRGKLPIWLPRGAGWVLAAPAGLLIPFRDQEGRLVGLQVRPRDQSGNKGKYRQVSAGGFPASVHVSRLGEGSPRVWITEGALKADIASLYTGERFIGLPGVSFFRGLEEALKGLRPQKVVLAFDADYGDNPHVRRSLQHLSEMLSLSGWRVRWAVWEKSLGKGIDDVLTEGHGGEVRIQASPPFAR